MELEAFAYAAIPNQEHPPSADLRVLHGTHPISQPSVAARRKEFDIKMPRHNGPGKSIGIS